MDTTEKKVRVPRDAHEMILKNALDYFNGGMEHEDAQSVWKKAIAYSECFFPDEDARTTAISHLNLMKDFYRKRKDHEREVVCVRAMAEFGEDAGSQNLMGRFYSQGIGLEKDKLAALYWFNKAEEQGDLESKADCENIFQKYYSSLSREDFAEQIGTLAQWCRTGRGPVPLDQERGAYWTGRMEKALSTQERLFKDGRHEFD